MRTVFVTCSLALLVVFISSACGLTFKNACESSTMQIACPEGTVISINQAQYGRPRYDLHTCSNSNLRSRSVIKRVKKAHCGARSSMFQARRHCNGKSSCSIRATNSVFGDPCRGIYKFLMIGYICRPRQHWRRVCEHQKLRLSCPQGSVIQVHHALYGRARGDMTTCGNNKHVSKKGQKIMAGHCKSRKSVHKVVVACNGKTSCSIRASNGIFGDPCRGIFKYLEASFVCLAGNIRGYAKFDGKDYTGHDIRRIPNYNIHQCATFCNSKSRCQGFVVIPNTKTCWIKREARTLGSSYKSHSTAVLYLKHPQYAVQGYRQIQGKDYPGYDIRMHEKSNPQECGLKCDQASGCTGFLYQYTTRRCWVKSKARSNDRNVKNLSTGVLYIRLFTVTISGYRRELGKTIRGHDLHCYANVSPIACANRCSAELKCQGIAYQWPIKRCCTKFYVAFSGSNVNNNYNTALFMKNFNFNIRGYNKISERDYVGHDIKLIPYSNPQLCGHDCNLNSTCKGVVYQHSTRQCWLKSQALTTGSNYKRSSRNILYIKRITVSVSGYTKFDFKDSTGSDIKVLRNSSPVSCSARCDFNAKCKGFVYNFHNRNCWLKKRIRTSGSNFRSVRHGVTYKKIVNLRVPTYESSPRKIYSGFNIKCYNGKLPQACAHECNKLLACQGISFLIASKRCCLKSAVKFSGHSFRDNVDGAVYIRPITYNVHRFTKYSNSLYKGHNIKRLVNSSPQLCGFVCANSRQCLGFVYQSSQRSCWLKSQAKLLDPYYKKNNRYVLYMKQVTIPVSHYKYHMKKDYPGYDLQHYEDSSPALCKAKCEDNGRCMGFEYEITTRRCWIKWKVADKGRNFKAMKTGILYIMKTELSGYVRYPGKAYLRHNLRVLPNSNRRSCRRLCNRMPNCYGFVFKLGNRRCELKGEIKTYGPSSRTNSLAEVYLKKHLTSGFTRFPQKDFPGHDLKHYKKSTIQLCAQYCESNIHCVAFVYNTANRNCFIKNRGKSSGSNFVNSRDGELFIRENSVSGYTRYERKDYPGSDIRNFPKTNRQTCGTHCNRNTACIGFVFNTKTSMCWIKRQAQSSGPNFKDHVDGELFIENDLVHGYRQYPRRDYRKSDIRKFTNSNRQACGDHCHRNKQCTAFVFNIQTRKCYLKKKGEPRGRNFVRNANSELFIMNNNIAGYARHPRREYTGFALRSFPNYNRYACAEECNTNSLCVAFVYNVQNRNCHLKSVGETRGTRFIKSVAGELFIKTSSRYVSDFRRYPRKDYGGHDLRSFPNSNRQTCAQNCRLQNNCVGFVYNVANRNCFIKYEAESRGPRFANSKYGDLYIRKSTRNPLGFSRYPRKDYGGFDIKSFRKSNRQACALECRRRSNCVAFVFNIVNRKCFVKYEGEARGSRFANNKRADLYIRKISREISGYKRYPLKTFSTRQIGRYNKLNRASCAVKCNGNPDCGSFVFNFVNFRCYLLDSGENKGRRFTKNNNNDLFIRKSSYNVRGYHKFIGRDYQGHNLKHYSRSNRQSCRKACNAHIACVGFVYNVDKGDCWIKRELKTTGPMFTTSKFGEVYKKSESVSGFSRYPRKDFPGYDIKDIKRATKQQCATACLGLSNCAGFQYNRTGCWLKRQVKTSGPNFKPARNGELFILNTQIHGFTRYVGREYLHNTIKNFGNSNRQACANHCHQNIRCVAFVFRKNNRLCQIKRYALARGKNFKRNIKAELFIINGAISGYNRHARKDYALFDIARFRNYNRYACSKQCDKSQTCVAFVYNIVNRNCFIKFQGESRGSNFKTSKYGELFIKRSSRAVPRYARYVPKDFPGFDIGKYSKSTRQSCGRICNRNSACVAFVYNVENRNCYIKNRGESRGSNVKTNNHGELFIKRSSRVVSHYARYVAKGYPGFDIGKYSKSTRQSCGRRCNRNSACVAFVYNIESRNCYIKNRGELRGSNVKTNNHVELFIKRSSRVVSHYARYVAKGYPGFNIGKYSKSNRQSCGRRCNRNSACVAFVYNIESRNCYIKNRGESRGSNVKTNNHGELFIKRSSRVVRHYVRYIGKDYPGFDIKKYSKSTRQSCGRRCNRKSACVAFVYNIENRNCYIKNRGESRGPKFRNTVDGDLYIKQSSRNLPNYERYPRRYYRGNNIRTFRNLNRRRCGRKCDQEPRCVSFVYNIENRNCLLKHAGKASGPQFKRHSDRDFYLRKISAARPTTTPMPTTEATTTKATTPSAESTTKTTSPEPNSRETETSTLEPESTETEAPSAKPQSTPTETATSKPESAETEATTPETETTETEAPSENPESTETEAPSEKPEISDTEATTPAPESDETEAPSAKPESTETEAPSEKPEVSGTEGTTPAPESDETEVPSAKPESTETEAPSEKPEVSGTEARTPAPESDETEAPSAKPESTETEAPSEKPEVSGTEGTTPAPESDETEVPSAKPESTETEAPSEKPEVSGTEARTPAPESDETEAPSAKPESTETEASSEKPEVSDTEATTPAPESDETEVPSAKPESTETEAPSEKPEISDTEATTPAPESDETEVPSAKPESTETEAPSEKPEISDTEATTPAPESDETEVPSAKPESTETEAPSEKPEISDTEARTPAPESDETEVPSAKPESTETEAPSEKPEVSGTEGTTPAPESDETEVPSAKPESTETEAPSEKPEVSGTEARTPAPESDETEAPSAKPESTETEASSEKPEVSDTEATTPAPESDETEVPSAKPESTETEAPSEKPEISDTEATTPAPESDETEAPSAKPESTETEAPSKKPEISDTEATTPAPESDETEVPNAKPESTETEAPSEKPEVSDTEATTPAPESDETEVPSAKPESTETEAPSEKPEISDTEATTPAPESDETEVPNAKPESTETEAPSEKPEISDTEATTPAPKSDETEAPSAKPESTETEASSEKPEVSDTEATTPAPESDETEVPSAKPESTETEATTPAPESDETEVPNGKPESTATEAPSAKPEVSDTETATPAPESDETEVPNAKPKSTATEAPSAKPEVSDTEATTPAPESDETEAPSAKPEMSDTETATPEPETATAFIPSETATPRTIETTISTERIVVTKATNINDPAEDGAVEKGEIFVEGGDIHRQPSKPLGMGNTVVADDDIYVSSSRRGHSKTEVRPDGKSWIPKRKDRQPAIAIDFGSIVDITSMKMSGDGSNRWISKFNLFVSINGDEFQHLLKDKAGNSDGTSSKLIDFTQETGQVLSTRWLKIMPVEWENSPALKVEFYGFRREDDPNLLRVLREDEWTKNITGCPCVGEKDQNKKRCACCNPGGCQCANYKHQCVRCDHPDECGNPRALPKDEVDAWTKSLSGCECSFDKTRKDCACCKNKGCQCGKESQHQCVACGDVYSCGRIRTDIFKPNYCVQSKCNKDSMKMPGNFRSWSYTKN
ncbi:DgyrCDS10690 [Dimorphilus gyrociliatus]|uniref:DgyrCDS10690 n=1 Tax=Dimorphilus gyrociliatus TaxID=2664684 RepID=A0A7I8W123_9ANNE|nr:DgyrCDS10690 [Dimorphilus gyrociliatus]